MSDILPCLPPEIWAKILQKLPVKTLGKFRCVCKSWNALIISSSFVVAHSENYSLAKGNSFLLYRQFTNAPQSHEEYTLFHDSVQKESKLEPHHTFTCPFMTQSSGTYFRVVGSVNGLICLSDDLFGYSYLVIIWNPLIHKYIRLPVPEITYHIDGAYISAFGFGYDSTKATHKVLRVIYMREKNTVFDKTPPVAALYSVQEGKWRSVSTDVVMNICISDYWWSQCFLNRSIHWVAWERDADTLAFDRNCFLLFDAEEEKFKRMKFPEALAKECTLNLCVMEYGSKLSVIHSVLKGGAAGNEMTCCEIWIKGDYYVGSSWCKMADININTGADLSWVQCLRKNGDIVGFTKKGELVTFDPLTKQIKEHGLRGAWCSWFTCSYTESLILLDVKKCVSTYGDAKGLMKKFEYKVRSNGVLDMKEKEVRFGDDEEEQYSSLFKTAYHQGKFILLEQLRKFDGHTSKDPSEYLAMANIDFSELISAAETLSRR